VSRSKEIEKDAAPRDPFPVRVKRFFVNLCKTLFFLVCVFISLWFGYRLHFFLFESPYFQVNEVKIPDVSTELKEEILESTGLDEVDQVPLNLVKLRVGTLKRKIREMPKIRTAQVFKKYPSTLRILVQPRKCAVIVSGESLFLADAEGVIMEHLEHPGRKSLKLPVVTGLPRESIAPGALIRDPAFFKALDVKAALEKHNEKLYEKLSELNINPRGNITAVFEGGTEIRFGRKDPLYRLPELEAFMKKYAPSMKGLDRFEYLDLRFQRQIVYSMRQNRNPR